MSEIDAMAAQFADAAVPFSDPEGAAARASAEPMPMYVERAGRCPVERIGDDFVVLLRMADILYVNKHHDVEQASKYLGSSRPAIPLGLDGAEHRKYRRLLDPVFTAKRVAPLAGNVRGLADEMIDSFIDDRSVSAYSRWCEPLPSTIFLSILGLPLADLDDFLHFKSLTLGNEFATLPFDEAMARREEAVVWIHDYFNRLLDDRLGADDAGDDLLGWLLTTEVDGERLPREDLLDILGLLMIAGLDTVAASLACFLSYLARHPDDRRRLVADPSLWPSAIEELMRYESPVTDGGRIALADLDLPSGEHVAAGTKMGISWHAANLDPDAFDDPLTVDLERAPNPHIGFASGFHRCLGSHLARMEMHVALEAWHQRIPDYEIAPGSDLTYRGNPLSSAPPHAHLVNLADTPIQAERREEIRDWLAEHLTGEFARHPGVGGPTDDSCWELRLAWERELAEGGWLGITWPVDYGGRGGTLEEELVFLEEHFRARAPYWVGVHGRDLFGPTLLHAGSDQQKAHFLPRIMRCEDMWGQGFSEPEAGSDLGGVRTRAVREGDEWVLNGQKIWMTFGTRADWLYVLCRTDPVAPKHRGLSLILVPADQPGVDIRPIRNLADGAEFAEVFFTDALTRADLVVGPVDGAWSVVMGTVGTERGTTVLPYQAAFEQQLHDLVVALQARGRTKDLVVRQRLARAWIGLQLNRYNNARMLTRLVRDGTLGPEASLSKLFWSQWHRDLGESMMDLLGADATVVGEGYALDAFQGVFLNSRAETIYGGANEIQRNIVAERVLGLPKEPRA